MQRRTVLSAATALGMASVLGHSRRLLAEEPAPAPDVKAHPFIDAHSHVWSPDTKRWPLANGLAAKDLDPKSFTPEELLRAAHPVKVGRVVLIQHHIYHGWDNTYLTDCAAAFPGTFAVVGMLDDQHQTDIGATMDKLKAKRVTGFRITPRIYKDQWLTSPGMTTMWSHAAKSGQAMCCLIDAADLVAVNAQCGKHPETTVVIDHFARIGVDGQVREADVKQLAALAKHKRTYVKLSAYYALGKKRPPYDDLVDMTKRLLDAFGPERCMWASDAPYQINGDNTYAASLRFIQETVPGLTASDREWLLAKTAERVFFGE